MDPLDQIAAGHDPVWQQTFNHPQHGELTFTVPSSLRNADWMRHSSMCDRIIRQCGGNPDEASSRTAFYASACAGILTLMKRPSIEERRMPDPDNEDHERVERILYDPLEDENMDFPAEVWGSFFGWRQDLLARAGELGKDSGEIAGGASDVSLPAATVSP